MPYVSIFDCTPMMMCSWDSFVDPESIARFIDAFVNSLDLVKYGVKEASKEAGHCMIRRECTNFIFMEIVKESVPREDWLIAVKLISK